MGRIVRVRLTLINNDTEIRTELEDPTINREFNQMDADEFFRDLKPEQDASAKNTNDRKNKKNIPKGQRVQTDDYLGEPPYPHAGIHLSFDKRDEIEWFSDRDLDFIIDIAPDPELYRLPADLDEDDKLPTAFLHDHSRQGFHNPFERADYPLIVINGSPQRSGALKDDPIVRDQRYYKFSVTMLGTKITLDPHIDGH